MGKRFVIDSGGEAQRRVYANRPTLLKLKMHRVRTQRSAGPYARACILYIGKVHARREYFSMHFTVFLVHLIRCALAVCVCVCAACISALNE